MAETYYRIKLSTLTEIGDAIRAKSGATGDIAVTSLATSILNLEIGENLPLYNGKIKYDTRISTALFTVDGIEYEVEPNMTWAQWCDSKYNINHFYVDGGLVYISTDYYIQYANADQIIDPTIAYTGIHPGGGGSND